MTDRIMTTSTKTPDASDHVTGASGVPLTQEPTVQDLERHYFVLRSATSGTSGVNGYLTCRRTRVRADMCASICDVNLPLTSLTYVRGPFGTSQKVEVNYGA